MIIQFAQTADYWRKQSDSALGEGRTRDALLYARKALACDRGFDTWYAYADLLNRLELYDMSASVCLLYGAHMSEDEKADWCKLMIDNAERTANLAAILHYNKLLLELNHDGQMAFDDMMEEFVRQFYEGKEHTSDLMFSDEAHQKQNHLVYERMLQAYEHQDYQAVLELGQSVHPQYDYYIESLFLLGMSQVALGDTQTGCDNLRAMYKLAGCDARVLYHLDEIPDAVSDEDMRALLQQIDTTDNKDNLAVAAICAYRRSFDDLALHFAQCANLLSPDDPEGMFRLSAAYCNVGADAKADFYLRQAVTQYEDFFPLFLTHITLSAPVDLSFALVPSQLQEETFRLVNRCLERDYFSLLMYTEDEFRQAVRFLLSYPVRDAAKQARLVDEVVQWQDEESIAFAKQLLLEPNLPPHVRVKLVLKLLCQLRRGKVSIAMRYVANAYWLRLPPSFDDFGDKLQRAYAYAFCEMVTAGKKCETKLSRIGEKVYLTPPDFDYQANMLGLAMAVEGHFGPDKRHVEDVLMVRDWDSDVFLCHLDAVHHALNADED